VRAIKVIGSKVNDRISSAATIDGGAGDDVIGYTVGLAKRLDGGSGNDTLKLEQGNADLLGVRANLLAQVVTEKYARGDVEVSTTDFENVDFSLSTVATALTGDDRANVLRGGSASDRLIGNLGADTLTGGGGADRFVWTSRLEGGDTITDYTIGVDVLSFNSANFKVDGVYDVISSDTVGTSLDQTDLFVAAPVLNNAAQVRDYLNSKAVADHGMFVAATDSQGNTVLYYSAHAGVPDSSGEDFEFYQIANLGDVAPGGIGGDFFFA
jgi:hypothetical protein